MAETLTPNPIPNQKQKPPVPDPTSPYFLGSNDDKLERAAARAARDAAFRRKPVEVPPSRNSPSTVSCLDRHQIMELFHNCVKLASENKINQKNTWELKFIDHLSEIIEAESEDNNAETNFQKASCTLETGVKIYAVRVDAWHADAYRVLNGIGRVGLEEDEESSVRGDRTSKEREVGRPVKEIERKVSPLSTVESSLETLNVKKFDVAFAVDPLYYQTSAQFDEAGATGLLLCNLGVYGGFRVLFDSQEVPAKCISPTNGSTSSDVVDVSFAKDCIELMAANLHQQQDISPSLRVLIKQFDLPSRTSDNTEHNVNGNVIDSDKVEFNVGTSDATEDIGVQINNGSCDDTGEWSADCYYDTTVTDEVENEGNPAMQDYYEEPVQFTPNGPVVSDTFENAAWLFCKGLGYKLARNAWAGPDHWTYSKPNGLESTSARDSRPNCAAKRPKYKILSDSDIDFTRSLDGEAADICAPVKNLKSLLLPSKKISCSNKLPEDCHYQPEDLVKLFLLPNVMCLGKIRRKVTGPDLLLQIDDFDGSFSSWDNESTVDGPYDDYIHRDAEEDILVFEPRRVENIEVKYDQTSKQVDVHVLKETLWTLVQGSIQTPEVKMHVDSVSFRHVLTAFPDDCKAAATHDISPHLCFICLLHLANEHGLTIVGCPNMDDLSIHLPVACEETGHTECRTADREAIHSSYAACFVNCDCGHSFKSTILLSVSAWDANPLEAEASCTLETGVKIYAVRVDAWHADAYRVLNGIGRVGLEEDEESSVRGDRTSKEREVGRPVKEIERKVSPLSTVESSLETLNVKKFDVAFAVDPLYYQTSAQFDEAGATGLLLCNLGVYGGFRVLFDSQEVPAKCISPTNGSTSSDVVDVSFAKDCIELMAANLHQQQDISPSLRVLIKQFDLPSRTSDNTEHNVNGNVIDSDKVEFNVGTSDATEDIGVQINNGSCDDTGEWSADCYYDTTVTDEVENEGNPAMQDYYEEPVQFTPNGPVVSDTFENAAWLFCKGLGYKLARNAWAGPDHWTYSKPNGLESTSARDSRPNCAAKRPKYKILSDSDIDFTRSLDGEAADICAPVKNLKSLLLPSKKISCSNKLPEDCHYQPEDLVKLFLLPNVMCLGKIRRKVTGPDLLLQIDDFDGSFSSWDNESTVDGPYDDYIHRDAEEDILVFEPRRVENIEVKYDQTSKQVDVHVLKETLWTLVQGSIQTPEVKMHVDSVSFRHVLTAFPDDCKAAATHDISPHLCFICLLHLANEHGLTIVGCPNMDDLSIHLPVACEETGEVIQASS